MTKKLAVFVEGLTEQEFTIKLLIELAGSRGIEFEILNQFKGSLSFAELRSHDAPEISVLVANCCNDGQVKTQIIDRYSTLKSAGYSLIVGLRDVYPLKHEDIDPLNENLLVGLPVDTLPIHLHLAILETEAWFLEEISHFARINNKITDAQITANGFDHLNTRAHSLDNPAKTLKKIYQSVGEEYKKNKRSIQRTVNELSYEELYINTRSKAPSLDNFITSLEIGIF
jgi:Domain of unknown function (DUF4276)